ncbi:class I SAM-dependent methyltransferase [Crocinitomicaceae bacterium]|nr:class I SAM-dependent methyltransferase [Crocinitomicaceae bacterium]
MGKKIFDSDREFDTLYSEAVQKHSFIHWTPLEIIETGIDWLQLDKNSHVLDIGSGAGKFCAVAGSSSKARFTGIEMREDLVDAANALRDRLGADNVTFKLADITTIDFKDYSHFYYYNPFCEYIAEFDRIDDRITYDPDSFRRLEDYVINQFDQLPHGTRVVTYCSETFPFPSSYELKDLLYDGKLALWVKVR